MADGLRVLDILRKINPWFKTNIVPPAQLEPFRRREFEQFQTNLNRTDMATLIIGGRRVGKSVLMYQLIDTLLKSGINGKRILFVQGDNPILTEILKEGRVLNYILEIYQNYIAEESLENAQEIVYIFIDEAQNLTDWELEVKTLIDLKYKIKFIVTGSSSFELRRGSQNPLTGRVDIQVIQPFSFIDFARYQMPTDTQEVFQKEQEPLSDNFKDSLFSGDINGAFKAASNIQPIVAKNTLRKKLDEYLFVGGFPWVIANKKGSDVSKYLRDLLTTTISKDILTHVEIRDTQAFERLMVNLCLYAGTIVSYKTLADNLGIDERSVTKYVDYYAESHWAFISSPHVFHKKPDSIKSEKKFYVIDSGIMNTLAFKDEGDLKSDRTYRGHVLENVLHNHLLSFMQTRIGAFQTSIPFWIENSTGKEIDFIFNIKNGVVPIESKSRISYDGSDLLTLEQFLKDKSSAKFGIITTEDTLEVKDRILLIPYTTLLSLL